MSPRGRCTAVLVVVGAALVACSPRDQVAATAREVCDRADDDGSGIADDLDANGNGLCDCLRIGVIGYPGRWGTIDLIQRWMGPGRAFPTQILAGETLTPELLRGLDVLIVQDVRDGVARQTVGQEGVGKGIGRGYSDAEVRALATWVDGGGGLMTLAGFDPSGDETANVNRLLAPFGLSYGGEHILAGPNGTALPVTHWSADHPIASGITQVEVNSGYPVMGGTPVAWEPAPGAYDVGRATTWGRGHVFAWGDDWIEYDAQWSLGSEFQVKRLWQNALRWLTRAGYCQIPLPP